MIIPTNNNVLVKPIKRERVETDSGIYLPNGQNMQEESLRFGEIVHQGDTEYKKGDKIFYSAYSAVWLNDDNGDYQLLCAQDIMGLEK